MLQHGSILLDDDQARLAAWTLGDAPAALDQPLNRVLDRPVAFGAVAAAVAGAARRAWTGEWADLGDPDAILRRAVTHVPHFASDAWTWRR